MSQSLDNTTRSSLGRLWLAMFGGFGHDVKVASRRLLATPMFTAFAMVSLALGVGVTTAAYSVVERVFWSDLGIRHSDGLVLVGRPGRSEPELVSAPDFEDLRAAQSSFTELAASAPIYTPVLAPIGTEIQRGEAVDGAYFRLLGIQPIIGRVIGSDDDQKGTPVVVISHHLWTSRFASNPRVVGQAVRLSGRPFEIVGVAPESFAGPVYGPTSPGASRLWVPLSTAHWLTSTIPTTGPDRERRLLVVVGRMRPGATEQGAAAELATLGARLDAEYPPPKSLKQPTPSRGAWTARRIDAPNQEQQVMRRFGAVALGLVALVLVVACTNLANLVLARGTTRQHELAVRAALGASRWRLVREQCTESVLLALGGAVLSIAVLQFLIRALDVELPIAPSWMVSVQPRINTTALITASAALLLALVVFGLEPALQLTRKTGVREDLESGSGSPTIPRARRQRTLLRWQTAISAGFFIIASLSVRYLVAEARHDSGVDVDPLGVAMIDFRTVRWDESRARRSLERVIEQTRREPGVQAVAVSTGLPFGTQIPPVAEVSTTDTPLTGRRDHDGGLLIAGSPDFFRAAGIGILRGRGFTERDEAAASPVIVVSESLAKKMFGTVDAVGRELLLRVDFRGLKPEQPVKTATIVGIAEDTDTTHFFSRSGHTLYAPFAQEYQSSVTLVARGSTETTGLGALRAAVRKVEPDLAIERAGTGRAMLTGVYLFLRGIGITAVSLGALSLMLAMVGLYGVQSHIVARRTREIGIRVSLGATTRQIKRMVLADGYRPVLEGLAIGLFIGLAGRVIVRAVVVAPIAIVDPWMLTIVPLALIGAAFWACYLPARRASRVDPNEALRHL